MRSKCGWCSSRREARAAAGAGVTRLKKGTAALSTERDTTLGPPVLGDPHGHRLFLSKAFRQRAQ